MFASRLVNAYCYELYNINTKRKTTNEHIILNNKFYVILVTYLYCKDLYSEHKDIILENEKCHEIDSPEKNTFLLTRARTYTNSYT